MQTDGGVGRAGSAGDEGNPRPPGELAIGLGHIRRRRLVPAGDERKVVGHRAQGLERREIALAGHAEDHACAMCAERIDKRLAAAMRRVGHHLTARTMPAAASRTLG